MGQRSCGRTQARPGRERRVAPGPRRVARPFSPVGVGAPRPGRASLRARGQRVSLTFKTQCSGLWAFASTTALLPAHFTGIWGRLKASPRLGGVCWAHVAHGGQPTLGEAPGEQHGPGCLSLGERGPSAGRGGASQAALRKPRPLRDLVSLSTTSTIVPAGTPPSSLSPQTQHTGGARKC